MIGDPFDVSSAQLRQAELLLRQRNFEQAQAICEALIRRYPNYIAALYTLGLALAEQNKNEHALDCLVRASMLGPRNKPVSTALAEIYLRLGANEMAARTLKSTRSFKPADASACLMLGDIFQEDCDYESARDAYIEALAIDPALIPATLGLGWCQSHLGNYADAAQVFEALIARGVRLLEPLRALASLPASVVSIDLSGALEKAQPAPNETETEFRTSSEFLRASLFDRGSRYAEAWELLTRANRTIFSQVRERAALLSERWLRTMEALRVHPGRIEHQDDPDRPLSLFILGASRSGKTLVESLIARLPGVKRGYENPCLQRAVLRTFQESKLLSSGALDYLPPQLYSLCGERYAEELQRRAGSARVFTNTGFGYIHAATQIVDALPGTRFILVKRDVNDTILRIYMTKYRSGNAYAYDLKTAREHVVHHHKVIDLMAEKFPGIVRVVQYEDMVADPTAAQRVAVELCGLAPPHETSMAIESDFGCAAPYLEYMTAALRQ